MLRIQSITVRFSVHHCGQVNTFELQDAGTPCAYTNIERVKHVHLLQWLSETLSNHVPSSITVMNIVFTAS